MVAIAPGMALAHSVVPSSGSTAMSTCGPALMPTFSPMNSIGASSRSPSPITTVPSIGNLFSSRRIERAIHRVLAGCIGNQNHRHRRSLVRGPTCIQAIAMALHDRFDGYLLLRETRSDGRGGAGKIARHQADIIAALVTLHRGFR